jgi:uncharacterized membrane protein
MLVLCAAPLLAYRGLSVSTQFPSVYTSKTDLITFELEVRNYDLSPQRVDLSVTRIPDGWDHVFIGGGGVVEAVFAEPEKTAKVQLWVEPPKDLEAGTYDIVVRARGSEDSFSLPLTVKTGQNLPQRLSLDPELPSVRGTPDSDFTYKVTLQNNSASEVLVNFDARAPEGFQVKFSQQYGGGKELSTLPVDAGSSKDIKVEVTPPQGVSEGSYTVEMLAKTEETVASTELNMDIKGQPKLAISGPGGRLSGSAVAGREKTFTLNVQNDGTAAAKEVSLSSSSPRNWNVEFEPESLDEIPAGESKEVRATVTPSSEAITGDYNVNFRAGTDMGNTSEKFRITVRTSSLWGIVAVLIIAAAAVVLVFSVRRFGRR